MIASETVDTQPDNSTPESGTFARCPRCSMEVRRSEMQIHLAHSHNIGPEKEKKDKRRRGRRS